MAIPIILSLLLRPLILAHDQRVVTQYTTGLLVVDSINLDRVRFKKRRLGEAAKDQARQAIRAELRRVFEGSPQWTPATRNGQPVRVKFSMPYTVQAD